MLVAAPLVAWIVGALEGAAVVAGVSAVGAGLIDIGIPKDSVLKYEQALKTDKFLLMVWQGLGSRKSEKHYLLQTHGASMCRCMRPKQRGRPHGNTADMRQRQC